MTNYSVRNALLPSMSAALLAWTAMPALATTSGTGSVQTQMQVSATAVHFCKSASVGSMLFGDLQPDLGKDASADISVRCTRTSPVEILLSKGVNGTAVTARKMTSSAGTLDYALYSNSARTSLWGDTVGGTGNTVTAVGAGLATDVVRTVYGRVPVQRSAAPGAYSDTVLVTINY